MAPRDDDKALDGLIRRSLMRQPPGSDCPEPDILAAYQDGSLDNEEIARHELHFSECSRCREQLAVMARAGAEVEIPVHMEVAAFAKAAPTVAAPASLEPRARRRSWLFDWRWLAPVAAVVVFAAVVYMRLTPPVQKFAQLGDQIAQSKRATAPAAPAKQLEDAYQQVPAPSAPATQPPPPVARHAATAATPGPAGAEQDRSLPNKESRTGQRGPTREEQERRRALIQRLEEQRLSSSLENEPGKSAADAGAEMDRMMASGRNAGAPAQHAAAAAPRSLSLIHI